MKLHHLLQRTPGTVIRRSPGSATVEGVIGLVAGLALLACFSFGIFFSFVLLERTPAQTQLPAFVAAFCLAGILMALQIMSSAVSGFFEARPAEGRIRGEEASYSCGIVVGGFFLGLVAILALFRYLSGGGWLSLTVFLAAGLLIGLLYRSTRPKPVRVELELSSPAITPGSSLSGNIWLHPPVSFESASLELFCREVDTPDEVDKTLYRNAQTIPAATQCERIPVGFDLPDTAPVSGKVYGSPRVWVMVLEARDTAGYGIRRWSFALHVDSP